ncbi:hypothetical protein BCR44DRAFT_1441869 [Catenaria anguillulae PL171]|uniref:Uncharacterized protein n=1 Tax=Catenaria anguillulae PL171 TaxID=765915 RepID=A0A1Y2HEW8_9FUNG|nr:hypothetical protein BCR44DRAFT_1441869 [Catenaria anguillulae PL171]
MASRVLTMCNRSGSATGMPCRASRGVETVPKMRRLNWLRPGLWPAGRYKVESSTRPVVSIAPSTENADDVMRMDRSVGKSERYI